MEARGAREVRPVPARNVEGPSPRLRGSRVGPRSRMPDVEADRQRPTDGAASVRSTKGRMGST